MKHVLLFLLSLPTQLPAQQADTLRKGIASVDDAGKRTNFTVGTVVANDISYYGQVAMQPMPYAAVAGSLTFPSGLYFTSMAYKILNSAIDTAIISASNFGVGYGYSFTENFSGDIGYNYTLYPKNSPFLQASTPHSLSATLAYEHWLTSALTGDYNFGNAHDFFVTLANSKELNLGSISDRDIVYFTPEVNMTAGTQEFYRTYKKNNSNRGKGQAKGQGQNQPNPNAGMQTISTKNFGLISYNFKLPLSYNRSSYLLELAYQLSIPNNNFIETDKNGHSFFTFSFYYQF